MQNKRIDISVVSYANTWPMLYGIKNFPDARNKLNPVLDFPAECARKIISGKTSIGLLPVGGLLSTQDYRIVTKYCIGADSHVRTVMLFSNTELSKVKNIILDYQSATSVLLARILVKHFWKLNVNFNLLTPDTNIEQIPNDSAILIIGDRCFGLKNRYQYSTDLATEWNKFTGYPFAFAVWVANKNVSEDTAQVLEKSIEWGLNNLDDAIKTYNKTNSPNFQSIKKYLTDCIKYELTDERRKAIEKYLTLAKDLNK
ncbi:MAG TPA: menaquinone biosynthesis protein [Salinivirgaceae bacterium]|nr:menaquinone biosynthesis protein [Salinivirgaceae bacterium]